MLLSDWLSARIFSFILGNNLVYNTCWEDPRLDRIALQLGPDDTVLVITSAGCNALDYLLTGVRHVYAVDLNPRQNALLELKIAAIRRLDYASFFAMFGRGRLPGASAVYHQRLRALLSPWSQRYWDRRIRFFDHPRRSFYFRGSSGSFARLINAYVDHVCRVRPQLERLLEATTLDEQQRIYHEELAERFWSPWIKFLIDRDTTLSLVGVPRAQRRQIEAHYRGGIVQYVHDCVETVFSRLPLHDNYFWRVYLTGDYTPACCPEYVRAENFARLQGGLIDRLTIHTTSVHEFLHESEVAISRFVLLDHMDWLAERHFPLLEQEWQGILRRATPGARAIWRSGGLRTDFLDDLRVQHAGGRWRLGDLLTYHEALAHELHSLDRVHTYGSFHIADFAA